MMGIIYIRGITTSSYCNTLENEGEDDVLVLDGTDSAGDDDGDQIY